MIANSGKASRPQIQANDLEQPESFRKVLNDTFLEFSQRIEALELVKGITLLDEIYFETGSVDVTPNHQPFVPSGGGLRVSCPFSPTGLVLLRLECVNNQTISALSSDVKWHYAAGPSAGTGVLHIDFVTGIAKSSRYKMRVGVTRA